MTADQKYFLCYIWNLHVVYQMELSKKVKIFSEFFSPFLKSSSNFEHFEKQDNIQSQCISENIDWERYS